MKKSFRYSLTTAFLVSSLALVGVSCQQQDDAPAETTGTLDTTTTPALPTDTGTSTTEPFTVDLLPSDTSDTLPIDDQLGAGALDTDTAPVGDSPFDVEEIEPATPGDDEPVVSSAATPQELEQFIDSVMTQFGTFTNQDRVPYQNLIGLENDVTQGMQAYLDTIMVNEGDSDAPFFGRTTSVVSQVVLQDQATDTRVLVVAERQDVAGASSAPETYYVTYVVRVVEDRVGYLLDGIYEVSVGANPLTDSDE